MIERKRKSYSEFTEAEKDLAKCDKPLTQKEKKLKHKQQIKDYQRNYIKNKYDGYLGKITCPRCGRVGYVKRMKMVNIKTGTTRKWKLFYALHLRFDRVLKRVVYDGCCYIGCSPNDTMPCF